MPAKILVCGATRTEAEACRQGLKKAGLENRFEILRTGIGPAEAAEALKNRLSQSPRPSIVISSGFAGSWSPSLDIGTWISAKSLSNELKDTIRDLRPIAGTTEAHLISVPEILETPPRELTEAITDSPVAVDMETFALAQVCRRENIELRVLRYITDSPKHPLPAFVRHFTDVAVKKDLPQRMESLLKGSRALISGPKELAGFMKQGLHWRTDLIDGWARLADDIQY